VTPLPGRGLLDTSVFIANESGRRLSMDLVPDEVAISPITLAELQIGVHAARDVPTRARRLATLDSVSDIQVLPIDERVAASWATLRVQLAEAGRKLNVNDLWIAATARAYGLPVVTQDDDFSPLVDLAGLELIRV
jgi:predicted nucleic acid-binding protein